MKLKLAFTSDLSQVQFVSEDGEIRGAIDILASSHLSSMLKEVLSGFPKLEEIAKYSGVKKALVDAKYILSPDEFQHLLVALTKVVAYAIKNGIINTRQTRNAAIVEFDVQDIPQIEVTESFGSMELKIGDAKYYLVPAPIQSEDSKMASMESVYRAIIQEYEKKLSEQGLNVFRIPSWLKDTRYIVSFRHATYLIGKVVKIQIAYLSYNDETAVLPECFRHSGYYRLYVSFSPSMKVIGIFITDLYGKPVNLPHVKDGQACLGEMELPKEIHSREELETLISKSLESLKWIILGNTYSSWGVLSPVRPYMDGLLDYADYLRNQETRFTLQDLVDNLASGNIDKRFERYLRRWLREIYPLPEIPKIGKVEVKTGEIFE